MLLHSNSGLRKGVTVQMLIASDQAKHHIVFGIAYKTGRYLETRFY